MTKKVDVHFKTEGRIDLRTDMGSMMGFGLSTILLPPAEAFDPLSAFTVKWTLPPHLQRHMLFGYSANPLLPSPGSATYKTSCICTLPSGPSNHILPPLPRMTITAFTRLETLQSSYLLGRSTSGSFPRFQQFLAILHQQQIHLACFF